VERAWTREIVVRLALLVAAVVAALATGTVSPDDPAQVPQVPHDGGRDSAPAAVTAAQPEKETLELNSGPLHPGLPLAESSKGVFGVSLTAEVVKNRFGRGALVLDPDAPAFDEFGFRTPGGTLLPIRLECTVNLVKKRKFQWQLRRGGQDITAEQEWLLFRIQGPKITSRLFLAMVAEKDAFITHGRLLVHDKDGKVRYAVDVQTPPPHEPCHPGCFPAGTAIQVPGGTRPIERIRAGDLVTTVGPDGAGSSAKLVAVFVTRNRLVEVRTEAAALLTTTTQPFALAGGGLRAAGDLKAGDRIDRWNGGRRRATTVQSVSATGREEPVFNLILGDPAIFVANGHLVRSKPPAPAATGPTEGVLP
jgi:hypothetical protein